MTNVLYLPNVNARSVLENPLGNSTSLRKNSYIREISVRNLNFEFWSQKQGGNALKSQQKSKCVWAHKIF